MPEMLLLVYGKNRFLYKTDLFLDLTWTFPEKYAIFKHFFINKKKFINNTWETHMFLCPSISNIEGVFLKTMFLQFVNKIEKIYWTDQVENSTD